MAVNSLNINIGPSWTNNIIQDTPTSIATQDWSCIAYGNGVYVGIANTTGVVAYSFDGTNWTLTTLPVTANFYSITYGNGIFVTCSYTGGYTAYSTDGINWSSGGNLPTTGFWESVTYGNYGGNNIFLAVAAGSSNLTARSLNGGVTWSSGGTLPSSANWRSVTFGNGVFIAVTAGSSNLTARSLDGGVTWSSGGTLPSSNYWISVAYGNGAFVAVAGRQLAAVELGVGIQITTSSAAYSFDGGVTWNASTLPFNTSWTSVTYGNGVFVAVDGLNGSAYSFNGGAYWLGIYTTANLITTGVTYGNGKFVTICSSSNISETLIIKPNPTTETLNKTKTLNSSISYITNSNLQNYTSTAHGNGIYVAINNVGNTALCSNDGKTWSASTLPGSSFWQVTFAKNRFVAVSQSAVGAYSFDGVNWTATTLHTSGTYFWRGVTWDSNRKLFVSFDINLFKLITSADGITWSAPFGTLPYQCNQIVSSSTGTWIVIAGSGSYAYSTDGGLTWTSSTFPVGFRNTGQYITYGNGKFVAIQNNSNVITYSSDGITWTNATVAIDTTCYNVDFNSINNNFVTVGTNNTLYYSTNNINNWSSVNLPILGLQYTPIAEGNIVVLVSNNNTSPITTLRVPLDLLTNYTNNSIKKIIDTSSVLSPFQYLAVGGGGTGGNRYTTNGGGGGGGGVLQGYITLKSGTTYTITIGAGGNGGDSTVLQGRGGNVSTISGSDITTITAYGGGYGSSHNNTYLGGSADGGGGPGASGGGGAGVGSGGITTGGASTFPGGNTGGSGNVSSTLAPAGGGGGAAMVGGNATTTVAGNGGDGLMFLDNYYGGGGGGGHQTTAFGTGGTGGGGTGGGGSTISTAGGQNTGGGGGGLGPYYVSGTSSVAGGSGIVILKIPAPLYTGIHPSGTAPVVSTSGNYKILTFNSSGTYTA